MKAATTPRVFISLSDCQSFQEAAFFFSKPQKNHFYYMSFLLSVTLLLMADNT
nr:MAG TPA: hypothetical protein [Caudoviricetes sp.]